MIVTRAVVRKIFVSGSDARIDDNSTFGPAMRGDGSVPRVIRI